MLSVSEREQLIRRLRRIEGQTQGIQRMLTENRDCREVLNQLASVRAATRQVSLALLKGYVRACVSDPDALRSDESLGDLIDTLTRV